MQCTSVLYNYHTAVGFGTMGRNMIIGAKETLDREHMYELHCTGFLVFTAPLIWRVKSCCCCILINEIQVVYIVLYNVHTMINKMCYHCVW